MPLRAIFRSVLIQTAVSLVLAILLLFLPAGTLAWTQGWILLALFFVCSQATGLWLLRHDPALLAERMKSPLSADQTPRDRAIVVAIIIAFVGWLVFMALDAQRFGWSHAPPWAQVLGAVLIIAAFGGWIRVLRANSFAATQIRLQPDRGQTVISTGPYAVVRHPMYAYVLLLMIGAPLLLGSLWGVLFGFATFVPLLALRIHGEEAMLMTGLTGYPEYARKVRYRLIPGIW
ncbi:MAG TPA: isoprenylcysteine carboxylmethyltransferase family protein [Acetobacteraceae bacterium]|nr:isoprenylcysteine carboxylmethyltransferase family protein [Acetobacteraceae bacterium]